MVKRRVILTKTRIQKFETVINSKKDDDDDVADIAWGEFNLVNPEVRTEYITDVRRADLFP